MQKKQLSKEQLVQKIEALCQELEDLKREKSDLEILQETLTVHADAVEAQLQESNKQLEAELIERQRAELSLQSLLAILNRDKADLEIILETTTEHGDIIENMLRNQCISDPLTGLFNRRYMEESLQREIYRAQRKQQSLGIVMLDLDRFKHFNNTYGHEAGDIVLREVGLFLQKNIRISDIACRYGGEEFILILPEASLEVTKARAEQLRQRVKNLNVEYLHQSLGVITISLGVACFPEHGKTRSQLVRSADTALYRAKDLGRDRVVTARGSKK